jgi:3-hydroxyacyl-CoA dehydrogenase
MKERLMRSKMIGIVGLGYMGSSIATCLLHRGMRVVGFTRPSDGFAKARDTIIAGIEDLIAHQAAEPSLLGNWSTCYIEAKTVAAMRDCDFVIETVTENVDVKRVVFDEIEAVVKPDVPVATNTSGLPITLLQEGLQYPERLIGMHWCAPCYVNPLLEIICGEKTNQATIDAAMRLAAAAGKEPGLIRKDIEGFIVNRLGYALFREALHLLDSGVADVATIDRMFQNVIGMYGGVIGPLRWMDLTGFAIYADVMERLFPTLDNSTTVPRSLRQLIDSGARGAAQGRGFFTYTPAEERQYQQLLAEHMWSVVQWRDRYAKHFSEIKQWPRPEQND